MDNLTLKETLKRLHDLLVQERISLIVLDLERMAAIQKEKAVLLPTLTEIDSTPDAELKGLVAEVQAANERNHYLLQASQGLFARMRRRLVQGMAPTYTGVGQRAAGATSGRLLHGSI